MKKYKCIILVLIALFLVVSCTRTKNDKEKAFLDLLEMTETDDVNQLLKVDYLNGEKVDLYAGQVMQFELLLYEQSKSVRFNKDDERLFYIFNEETKEWKSYANVVESIQETWIVTPNHKYVPTVVTGIMVIDSEVIQEPTTVRVATKGYLLDVYGEVEKPLLGYLDVTILPPK